MDIFNFITIFLSWALISSGTLTDDEVAAVKEEEKGWKPHFKKTRRLLSSCCCETNYSMNTRIKQHLTVRIRRNYLRYFPRKMIWEENFVKKLVFGGILPIWWNQEEYFKIYTITPVKKFRKIVQGKLPNDCTIIYFEKLRTPSSCIYCNLHLPITSIN